MELWELLSFYIPPYCLNLLLKSKPFYNWDKKMVHFDKQSRKYTKFRNKLKFKPKLLQHNLRILLTLLVCPGNLLGSTKMYSILNEVIFTQVYVLTETHQSMHLHLCTLFWFLGESRKAVPHYHVSCSRFPTFGEITGSAHRAPWISLALGKPPLWSQNLPAR